MRTFRPLHTSRGFGVLEVLIGGTVTILAILAINQVLVSTRRATALEQRRILAESYTTELLEFFRSLGNAQLSAYLQKNPITGLATPVTNLYPLCAHINILDRSGSSAVNRLILNADPIADIGPSLFDGGPPRLSVNRYYQVQVVDITTMVVNAAACGQPPTYVLGANERFLVTVGVTWVPAGQDVSGVQRMVATTVLPE